MAMAARAAASCWNPSQGQPSCEGCLLWLSPGVVSPPSPGTLRSTSPPGCRQCQQLTVVSLSCLSKLCMIVWLVEHSRLILWSQVVQKYLLDVSQKSDDDSKYFQDLHKPEVSSEAWLRTLPSCLTFQCSWIPAVCSKPEVDLQLNFQVLHR